MYDIVSCKGCGELTHPEFLNRNGFCERCKPKSYKGITVTKEEELLSKIEKECKLPTCNCNGYDDDPAPTGEERLKYILKLIKDYKAEKRGLHTY